MAGHETEGKDIAAEKRKDAVAWRTLVREAVQIAREKGLTPAQLEDPAVCQTIVDELQRRDRIWPTREHLFSALLSEKYIRG